MADFFDLMTQDPIRPADAYVRSIVESESKEFGIPVMPDVMFDISIAGTSNAYTNVRMVGKTVVYGLFFPPDYRSLWTDEQLRGAIAHELAHVATKDPESTARRERAAELAADRMAAKHGYGESLISVLGVHKGGDSAPIDTHPSYAARVKAIRAATVATVATKTEVKA
jgi:hypothetical protein